MSFLRSAVVFGFGLLALAPVRAQAQELRFTLTAPGGVTGTGNTLGLSKAQNSNGPGIEDSIGTFISLGNGVDDVPLVANNPWPQGTTNDWTQNGSSAVLMLPVESEVAYAELLWGGSYLYGEDVTAFLETAVTLTAGGSSIQVTPDPATALTTSEIASTGFAVNYYFRSADVTAFVASAGEGTFAVSGVPATQTTTINSLNAAGWTLVVAYRDQAQPTKNLSVFVGGSFVDEASQQDYQVSGFCAPPAGVVQGTVVVSAIEGDADLVGDQLLIAPTLASPFVNLSGPNNPAQNFFSSQLNDGTGQLDVQGTFGQSNHDAIAGTNVSGGRQGWDVTTVPVSSQTGQLVNGQTSAVIRTITTGDSYVPTLAAFAIDVNAPDFGGGATGLVATPDVVEVGDTLTVTATLENGGEVTAQATTFTMGLPQGLSVVSFATDGVPGDINGDAVDVAALQAGVPVGDLPSGVTREVTIALGVDSPDPDASLFLTADWSYGFEVCAGGPLLTEVFSQSVLVGFDPPETTTSTATATSSASTSGAGGNGGATSSTTTAITVGGSETTVGATGSGGSADADPSTVIETDGCNCELPGSGRASGATSGGLFALALAALGLARRRRSS